MTFYIHHNLSFLLCSAKLEKLLNYVIAKDIDNQLVGVVDNLIEDKLSVRHRAPLKFLLNEAATMLV